MKRTMKAGMLGVLLVLGLTACTRRVQVESEPNRFRADAEAPAPAAAAASEAAQ